MKWLLIFFVTLILINGCSFEIRDEAKWKTIQVGDYLFDFPPDFELIEEQGIDSYVGRIKGDSMSFGFDFGYYSNTLEQTLEEYLEKGLWKQNLIYQFMKPGVVYDKTNMPEIDVVELRLAASEDSVLGKGCDYVAIYTHEHAEFKSAVYIPKEIKRTNIRIDTINNQYRKIVWAKDPKKGTTGIYIRSLNGFNKSINNYLALSMATSNLTKEQQELAFKILKTVRAVKR